MPPKAFSRAKIFQQTTSSPWTTNFMHLQSFPRIWTKRNSWADPHLKPAKPSDRIKYWNIVPGDQIRLLGDREKALHEVLSINRLTNRVYLKGTSAVDSSQGKPPPSLHVPYARCQLFIGNFDFPPAPGQKEGANKPVFATRLGTTRPKWVTALHRYVWKRFAVNTIPRLSEADIAGQRLQVPWPQPEKPPRPNPGAYDTAPEVVTAVTYELPAFPDLPESSLNPPVLAPAPPDTYLRALKAGAAAAEAGSLDSLLTELELERELSNPHSRAKKQARWQAKQQYEKDLLARFLRGSLAGRAGRARKEARAEAVWRWKNQLAEEARVEKRRRWVNRGMEARMEKKRAYRAAKEGRRITQLRELVLEAAPNQVIPA